MSARACCGHIHVLRLYDCPSCEAAERRLRASLTGGSTPNPTEATATNAPEEKP